MANYVIVAVPAIIERDEFKVMQLMLASVKTGPILLTGIATCGGGMTLPRHINERAVHRYYTCCNAARAGESVCSSRSIRMDMLDDMVIEHLSDRLLTSTRPPNYLPRSPWTPPQTPPTSMVGSSICKAN